MKKHYKVTVLSFACLAVASQARADVAFHGYGQIVAGTVFSNNRTFPTESAGYSYHADPTFTPNSNFALQASTPLDSNISATAQILATGDNDFQPTFNWAYLKYQFNDTFALKAGRLQLPFYQYSDYQFVGEAYPWVVLPESVYFAQASHYDGLNLSAETSWGDWYFYTQAVYGAFDVAGTNIVQTSSGPVSVVEHIQDHNLFGMTLDSSYNDWLSLRAAAYVSKISITGDDNPNNPLTSLDTITSLLIKDGYIDTAKALTTSNDPSAYYVASAQIARNNWLFVAEYQGLQSIAGSSGFSPQIASEYMSLGYHFGKLLPIATIGHRNQWLRADKIKGTLPSGAMLVPGVSVDSVIDAIAGNPNIRNKDWFYQLGVRYDLTATVALKLDFTHYDSHYRTSDFGPAAAAYANPQDANRLLAAVTFSF